LNSSPVEQPQIYSNLHKDEAKIIVPSKAPEPKFSLSSLDFLDENVVILAKSSNGKKVVRKQNGHQRFTPEQKKILEEKWQSEGDVWTNPLKTQLAN
jgi:hypothetical protein